MVVCLHDLVLVLRCRRVKKANGRGVRQENVHSKTKEITGTLPYALCMCPTTITAALEESEDVTTACQVVDANMALRSTAVVVQTIYQKEDILAVRHNRIREISPFWLAVLLEDVQIQVEILCSKEYPKVAKPDK